MKKSFLVFIFILISNNLFPQSISGPIKRITFFDSDVKHPEFFKNSSYDFSENDLLFEISSNQATNIGLLSYDIKTDTFDNFVKITDNNYLNINPLGIDLFGEDKIIFYQTNRNGDWDLAYREYTNNNWNNEVVLTDPSGNETNPSIIENYSYFPDSVRILFQKDDSIFLLTKKENKITIDMIFQKKDSLFYSQPTGIMRYNDSYNNIIYSAAVEKSINGFSKLVYLEWGFNGKKSPEKIMVDSGNVSNPEFQIIGYLTFENNINDLNNIYFSDDPFNSGRIEKLIDNPTGNLYSINLSPPIIMIIEDKAKKSSEKTISNPFTYKLILNDSAFIRVTKNGRTYFDSGDSLIYTKVIDSKPTLDEMGYYDDYQIYCYVWEDSVDGKIGLLGKKESYKAGGGSINLPRSFILFQNYPNPFNPSTKIHFEIPEHVFVSLKVYDILGREVATIINRQMLPGRYTVKFSADNFASGVYIYRLKAGNFVQSKKMIILK